MMDLMLTQGGLTPAPYSKAYRITAGSGFTKNINFIRNWSKMYTIDSTGATQYFNTGWADGPSVVSMTLVYASAVTWIDVYTQPHSQPGELPHVYLTTVSLVTAISEWDDCNMPNIGFSGGSITSLPTYLPASITSLRNLISSTAFNQDLSMWDTSQITDMSYAFEDCSVYNKSVNTWDTSKVITMERMFTGCYAYNQPMYDFIMSNVTNIRGMFYNCRLFNQDINTWDVSKIGDFSVSLYECREFNQPLNNWNTIAATNLGSMFYNCGKFNQPLNNWETVNVTSMWGTFNAAAIFNQDISTWNTGNVTDMRMILKDAKVFNQNLSGWNVSKVTVSTDFALGATAWQTVNKPIFP